MDDFLQKLKKVVRIVLYGPAISKADCRKAGISSHLISTVITHLAGQTYVCRGYKWNFAGLQIKPKSEVNTGDFADEHKSLVSI